MADSRSSSSPTQDPEDDEDTWKGFTRERSGSSLSKWKPSSEDVNMGTEDTPEPQGAEQLGMCLKPNVELVSTPSTSPKNGDKVSASPRDSGEIIVPEDDRTSDPRWIRIRSRDDENRFMTVDPSWQKPRMEDVGAHLEEATFVLETFYDEKYGEFCTLLHEASKKYLAVDEETEEPTLRGVIRNPVCGSSATDNSLRNPPESEPSAADEPDASFASAAPPPSSVSAYKLDPCCLFAPPSLKGPTYLQPKLCENKSLSYKKTGQVTLVTKPHGKDFVLHPSRGKAAEEKENVKYPTTTKSK